MIFSLILCPLNIQHYIQKHYKDKYNQEEFIKNIQFIPNVFDEVEFVSIKDNTITCTLKEKLQTIKIFPKSLRDTLSTFHNKKINKDSKEDYSNQIQKELSLSSNTNFSIKTHEENNKIFFFIENFQPKKITNIVFEKNTSPDDQYFFLKFFKKYINKIYKKKYIENTTKTIQDESFKELFLENNFTIKEKDSEIEISNINNKKIFFIIKSNLNTKILKKKIKESYTKKQLSKQEIIKICKDFYDNLKYLDTEINIEEINTKNKKVYIISAKENKKSFIRNIKFSGYDSISINELENILKKSSSENFSKTYFSSEIDKILNTTNSSLISGNYYTLDFPPYLQEKIKHLYHEKGFPFIKVVYTCDQSTIKDCTFFIQEGNQYFINNITGIDESKINLLKFFKKNDPLNFSKIESNFLKELENFKKNNYIKVSNNDKNLEKFISYIDGNSLNVNFELSNMHKAILNEYYIVGNIYTSKKFLKKTIDKYFKKNTEIKTKKIEEFQEYLIGTKMFQEVLLEWETVDKKNDTLIENLTVRVVESPRKNISTSFGFTTELGAYLNNSFSMGSILGSNRFISFDFLFNKRINSYGDDNKKVNLNFIEYNLSFNYFSDQDIFSLGHYVNLNFSKKQLLYFDIKLFDAKYTLIKNLTKNLLLGTFYNFAYGDQFNSKNENNNGFVQIGSINIFSTLDLRNNLNYTTKGFFINLILEHSHTNYFSDKNINFFIAAIKTKFYIPINQSLTLSNYLNYKYQFNFLDFSIPIIRKIKFGDIDDPRGITAQNLNSLDSKDITTFNLKECHVVNFKTELRYLLTNAFAVGFFLDAGGFFLSKLHYSKGISLKIITPLGSISLDYGSPLRSSFLEGIFTLSLNFF